MADGRLERSPVAGRPVAKQQLVVKPRRRLRLSPQAATWLLALALAVAAVVLLRRTPTGPLLAVHLPWAVFVVAVLFAGAEIAYVSIEFRRQSYSFTIAGVPLVLGLLSSSSWQVVAAATLGPVLVLVMQRLPIIKITYNLAAIGFETALAGFVLHRFSDLGEQLSAIEALDLCGVIAVVDLLMSALVLALIRLHGQPVGPRRALGTLVPAALFNGIALTYSTIAAVLLADGPLGGVLLAALSLAGFGSYRAYTVLAARHHSLGLVNSFVEDGSGAGNVHELAVSRIARIRELLRAESAQVVLGVRVLGGPPDQPLQLLGVDDRGRASARAIGRDELDWLSTRVLDQDEAVLVPRATKDPGLRRWLEDRGAQDAILVPLPFGDLADGVVMVTDRMADHTTFTDDDLTLLRTLAGHLGVALRSTRLLHRLRHDATHDALTGLPNRVLFQERLEAADTEAGELRPEVLLLGLSGFKEVNDALGHEMGDRLLRVVAQRLTSAVPEDATVARLGGDEFGVLLPGRAVPAPAPAPDTNGSSTPDGEPERLGTRLAAIVAEPVVLDEARVSVAASVGIAVPDRNGTAASLLRQADTAMSAAKSARATVLRYTPELDRGKGERLALVADLRSGLDRGELRTLFQPKVDLRTRTVMGAEALVRWDHPSRGRLAPDLFIPLAESTGLIEPLTTLVLRDAIRACRGWRDAGMADVTVSVNISPRTLLDAGFPARVAASLAEGGLPPQALVLEITEGSLMGDQQATIAVLDALVGTGVRISLDDFGTGYSSLSYLQRLPVQEIKIDRSFVSDFASGGDRASALVSSILGLAAAFDLTVVAEGIEDAETLERLAALSCDIAQGYYYGRPAPADKLFATARQLRGAPAVPLPAPRPATTPGPRRVSAADHRHPAADAAS